MEPNLGRTGIGDDVGGRRYGVGPEQLSRAGQQRTHFIELLLQRRISHGHNLPMVSQLHNSLTGKTPR